MLTGSSITDTIGFVKVETPNAAVTSFTYFSAPVTYYSSANPTNSIWILSSSRGDNPVVNSSIIVDDIAMVFNPTGLNHELTNSSVKLLNNPATDKLYFSTDNLSYQLQLISVTGNTVLNRTLTSDNNAVGIDEVANGIYFYTITGMQNNLITSGKVIIRK